MTRVLIQDLGSLAEHIDEERGWFGLPPRSAVENFKRWVGGVFYLCTVLFSVLMVGCCSGQAPDQAQFAPLSGLADSNQALIRVYGAPIPLLAPLAIHTWFVTKQAEEDTFHRWEVWQFSGGDHGHVHKDFLSPTEGLGAGGPFIIGQVIGGEAESIVAFVERESPQYPYRHTYVLFPGPNSNTYTRWVLQSSGWDLDLPTCALGAGWQDHQNP